MHNTFPLSISPKNGEGLRGYLLRLAAQNGFQTISDILEILGFEKKNFRQIQIYNKRELIVRHLRTMIENNSENLLQHFEVNRPTLIDDNSFKQNLNSSPTICTQCIREEGIINEAWLEPHNTHCAIHNCLLTIACPSCNQTLSWNFDIFEGCNCCGVRWHDIEVANHNRPTYLDYLDSQHNEELPFLVALYNAAKHVGNPNCFSETDMNYITLSISDRLELFEDAFQLLTIRSTREEFVRKAKAESLNKCQFFSKFALNNTCHPIESVPLFYVSPSSPQKLKFRGKGSPLLSERQTAKLLKVAPAVIKSLHEQKLFTMVKRNTVNMYSLVEIDAFMLHLSQTAISRKPNETELAPLSDIERLIRRHLVTAGEAIDLLLSSNIPIYYRSTHKHLEDFLIEPARLVELLDLNNLSNSYNLRSASELANYFAVSNAKLLKIAIKLNWPVKKTSRQIKKFELDNVMQSMERYVFLDLLCSRKPISKSGLSRFLEEHGFTSLRDDIKNQSLHIFEKSDNLLDLVDTYERNFIRYSSPRDINNAKIRKGLV